MVVWPYPIIPTDSLNKQSITRFLKIACQSWLKLSRSVYAHEGMKSGKIYLNTLNITTASICSPAAVPLGGGGIYNTVTQCCN